MALGGQRELSLAKEGLAGGQLDRLSFGHDREAVIGIMQGHGDGAVDAVIVAGCCDPGSAALAEVWPGLTGAQVQFGSAQAHINAHGRCGLLGAGVGR